MEINVPGLSFPVQLVALVDPANGSVPSTIPVSERPSSSTSAALTPTATATQAAATTGSIILKAGAGNLYGVDAVAGATAGFLLLLDLAAVPTAGATIAPKKVFPLAANGAFLQSFDRPLAFSAGIILALSSAIYTYTPIAAAFLEGEVK